MGPRRTPTVGQVRRTCRRGVELRAVGDRWETGRIEPFSGIFAIAAIGYLAIALVSVPGVPGDGVPAGSS